MRVRSNYAGAIGVEVQGHQGAVDEGCQRQGALGAEVQPQQGAKVQQRGVVGGVALGQRQAAVTIKSLTMRKNWCARVHTLGPSISRAARTATGTFSTLTGKVSLAGSAPPPLGWAPPP